MAEVIDLVRDSSPPLSRRSVSAGVDCDPEPIECIVISDDDDGDDPNPPPTHAPSDLANGPGPDPVAQDSDDYYDRIDSGRRYDDLHGRDSVNDSDDDECESLEHFLRDVTADRTPSEPRKRPVPSYQQTGEQPMRKKMFSSAPRWSRARPKPRPCPDDSNCQLPQLDYKPANRAPEWIKQTTPVLSRKARLMQLRLAS